MKTILLFITIVFYSCIPEVSVPIEHAPKSESNAITYTGYFVNSLQQNEDGTYRLSYWITEQTIQLHVSITVKNILIERGKSMNVAYVQHSNGIPTGKYVVYLTNDFTIGKFFN